jgi:hypothetical protein
MGRLLLGWVVGKGNAFLDIAFQALNASLKEDLLASIKVGERVVDLFCSGSLLLSASIR